MKYSRENYERYVLDFFEGNMSADERAAFEGFLILHPDIRQELDNFQLVTITADPNIAYARKEALLKDTDEDNRYLFFRRRYLAVAAALLVLVAVASFLFVHPRNIASEVVQQPIPEATTTPSTTPVPVEQKTAELAAMKESIVPSDKRVVKATDIRESPIVEMTEVEKIEPEQTAHEEVAVVSAVTADQTSLSHVRPTNPVVFIQPIITRNFLPFSPHTYSLDEIDLPLMLDVEIMSKERSKIGRFLAKVNLIPEAIEETADGGLKEKLLPESFSGLK